MADVFVKGCARIKLNPDQMLHALTVLKCYNEMQESKSIEYSEIYSKEIVEQAIAVMGSDMHAPDISGLRTQYDKNHFLLWDGATFDPEFTGRFIQSLLETFNIDDTISFTYINDCTNPLGYGGGAVIVNRDAIIIKDISEWLEDTTFVQNLVPGDLDDIIRIVSLDNYKRINRSGVHVQLEFLREQGYTTERIKKLLNLQKRKK